MSVACKKCFSGCHSSCLTKSAGGGLSYCYTGSSVSISSYNGQISCSSDSANNAFCCAEDTPPTLSPLASQQLCSRTFDSCDAVEKSGAFNCYTCSSSKGGMGSYQVLAASTTVCTGNVGFASAVMAAPEYSTSIYCFVLAASLGSTAALCLLTYFLRDKTKDRKAAAWHRLPLPWGPGLAFSSIEKTVIALDTYWTSVLDDETGLYKQVTSYVISQTTVLELLSCCFSKKQQQEGAGWAIWGAFASDFLLKTSVAIMFSTVNILAYDGCQVVVNKCSAGGSSVYSSSMSCSSSDGKSGGEVEYSGVALYLVPVVSRILGYGVKDVRKLLATRGKLFCVWACIHGVASVGIGYAIMASSTSEGIATFDERSKAIVSTLVMGYIGNLFEIPYAVLQWCFGLVCLKWWAKTYPVGHEQHVKWLTSTTELPAEEKTEVPPIPTDAVKLEAISCSVEP